MRCPYCNTSIALSYVGNDPEPAKDFELSGLGYQLIWSRCPDCDGFIIGLDIGKLTVEKQGSKYEYYELYDEDVIENQILYPKYSEISLDKRIPEEYQKEFVETWYVSQISPRASAALSRRMLQKLLREEYKILRPSLYKEIEEFITISDLPAYLVESVDAIRNVGNFAAHPSKDVVTGEIIDVEMGEAEWLLEIVEELLNFTFVRPKILAEKQATLDSKLKRIGKPRKID